LGLLNYPFSKKEGIKEGEGEERNKKEKEDRLVTVPFSFPSISFLYLSRLLHKGVATQVEGGEKRGEGKRKERKRNGQSFLTESFFPSSLLRRRKGGNRKGRRETGRATCSFPLPLLTTLPLTFRKVRGGRRERKGEERKKDGTFPSLYSYIYSFLPTPTSKTCSAISSTASWRPLKGEEGEKNEGK